MTLSREPSQRPDHSVAWVSVPRLNVVGDRRLSARVLSRFAAFQGLLNEELSRHVCIVNNPVLELLDHDEGTRRLLPWFLPQWSLVISQMMLSRQQLMIEMLGDSRWSRLAESPVMTVRRQLSYDQEGAGIWQAPKDQPNPAELLLRTNDQVHGWWESCQSLLPELGVLMPDMRHAQSATRQLCRVIEQDYLNNDLAVALATMYVLENALSNDVSLRLRHSVERCQDSDLPVPGLRFFDTMLLVARENSALVQHFIESWYFFDKPDEAAFMRQALNIIQAYDYFWEQFLHFMKQEPRPSS